MLLLPCVRIMIYNCMRIEYVCLSVFFSGRCVCEHVYLSVYIFESYVRPSVFISVSVYHMFKAALQRLPHGAFKSWKQLPAPPGHLTT